MELAVLSSNVATKKLFWTFRKKREHDLLCCCRLSGHFLQNTLHGLLSGIPQYAVFCSKQEPGMLYQVEMFSQNKGAAIQFCSFSSPLDNVCLLTALAAKTSESSAIWIGRLLVSYLNSFTSHFN